MSPTYDPHHRIVGWATVNVGRGTSTGLSSYEGVVLDANLHPSTSGLILITLDAQFLADYSNNREDYIPMITPLDVNTTVPGDQFIVTQADNTLSIQLRDIQGQDITSGNERGAFYIAIISTRQ